MNGERNIEQHGRKPAHRQHWQNNNDHDYPEGFATRGVAILWLMIVPLPLRSSSIHFPENSL